MIPRPPQDGSPRNQTNKPHGSLSLYICANRDVYLIGLLLDEMVQANLHGKLPLGELFQYRKSNTSQGTQRASTSQKPTTAKIKIPTSTTTSQPTNFQVVRPFVLHHDIMTLSSDTSSAGGGQALSPGRLWSLPRSSVTHQ